MKITFEAKLSKIRHLKIIKIPPDLSKEFSSRGMVMVKGKINNIDFKAPLEPDGKGSHWLEIDELLNKKIGIDIGERLAVSIEQTDEWIESDVPDNIIRAIFNADVLNQWNSITTRSKWEWIRWIRSTLNSETRERRIDVTMFKARKRR